MKDHLIKGAVFKTTTLMEGHLNNGEDCAHQIWYAPLT